MLIKDGNKRAANLFLRLSSLGAKLVLTLYMGRYFDLASIGSYGLVFSSVVLMTSFLGQDLGYIVKREIVGIEKPDALHKMRDQVVWYGVNYVVIAFVFLAAAGSGLVDIPPRYFVYAYVLGISENLGTTLYNNMNLLNQQVLANLALFVRAALWIPVAIVLGFYSEEYRTEDVVLACWAAGSLAALFIPLWSWRNWGWQKAVKRPVSFSWLWQGLRKSSLIWLGTIGLMAGCYVDRYFVNHFLSLEYVGVMTFYYSFVNAVLPLVESGALIFTAPKLVELYKKKEMEVFWRETFQAGWQVASGVAFLAFFLSFFVPFLGHALGKAEFAHEIGTFRLLLVAAWINAVSLVLYYVLFAQHRDRPIWVGNALYLFPVLLGNVIFIPLFGFEGIGYSTVFSGFLLLLWRAFFVRWPEGLFRVKKAT